MTDTDKLNRNVGTSTLPSKDMNPGIANDYKTREIKVGDILKLRTGLGNQLCEHRENGVAVEGDILYEVEVKAVKKAKITFEE